MLNMFTHNMTLHTRQELENLFQNKTHLSALNFAKLINSQLNKKDDRFYGVWKPGQTYQIGDIVYYEGALWEMKAEKEICAKSGEEPGKGEKWKSLLREVQRDLEVLKNEFTEYKQQMELRWQQLLGYMILLTLGLVIALVWLFCVPVYHLVTSASSI